MTGYYVYYGEEKYPFEMPSGWTVLQNAVSEEAEISLTIPEMVEKALAVLVSSPRLSEIVHQDSKVALIVDDWARSTPVSQILPTLLTELQCGGAKSENIDIVVALGTHRAMPREALAESLGEAVFQQYRVPARLPGRGSGPHRPPFHRRGSKDQPGYPGLPVNHQLLVTRPGNCGDNTRLRNSGT